MKIVVIGGSGLIGTKLVNGLRQRGHQVLAASPSSGVNTVTGEGLSEALAGAQVVVDVANWTTQLYDNPGAVLRLLSPRIHSAERPAQAVQLGIARCAGCRKCACPLGIPIYRAAVAPLAGGRSERSAGD